jgi:hypothetical protein
MRSRALVLTGLSALGAACGGGGSGGSSTAPAPTIAVSPPSATLARGSSAQPTATIGGVPATGVSWSSSNDQIVAVTGTGMVTASLQGNAVITATKGSSHGTVGVLVVPGPPAQMWIWSGNLQSAPAGTALKDRLSVAVLDASANLVKDVTVTFTVASGGGSLAAPTSATSDAQGLATSGIWTLGPTVGQQTVVASSGTLTPVTFTATGQ